MISRFDQLQEVKIENMKGGLNTAILNKVTDLPKNLNVYARITLKPNTSIGLHTHTLDEEIIYVLKGTPKIIDDGIESRLNEQDINICLKNHSHTVINDTQDVVELLAVVVKA